MQEKRPSRAVFFAFLIRVSGIAIPPNRTVRRHLPHPA